ncbi:phage Gp37/Gp68 family protein [Helicobacter fennelliae]|uniref:phage Gp37/Gp68 family protein n=1 Tax=Helicobacter fennelliae TaxID=215 RepID=UPI00215D8C20|nr:phage Gp37/Gp68 family protein [Helicobacter fennelliae]
MELFYFMSQRQDLIFQILTKRADRMLEFFEWYVPSYVIGEFADYFYEDMHKHIWFGVTAENQEYADKRIPKLLKLKDVVNKDIKCFVSIEPMLSEIDLTPYLDRLDWVIIGGEKIPNNPSKARLMEWEWVDSIYNQCKKYRVPLFFKQWGNNPTKSCHTRAESCKEFPID